MRAPIEHHSGAPIRYRLIGITHKEICGIARKSDALQAFDGRVGAEKRTLNASKYDS